MSHPANLVRVRVLPAAAAVLLALGLATGGVARAAKDDGKEKGKGPGSITGTVTGADSKPAVGVTVALFAAPPKSEQPAPKVEAAPKPPGPGAGKADENKPAPLKQTTTNARGEFAFPSVPPGEYHVAATAKGVRDDRKRVKIKPGEAQKVQLKLEPKEPAAK